MPSYEPYRVIVESIPVPVILVNQDFATVRVNRAARELFALGFIADSPHLPGDLFHCVNALSATDGCGTGRECPNCVIRKSARQCQIGIGVTRRKVTFDSESAGVKKHFEFLVTATPLRAEGRQLALLMLEDITEISLLKRLLVPVCMHCKKIRDSEQFWQQMEVYFHRYLGVDFSHGVCPDCRQQYYPDTNHA